MTRIPAEVAMTRADAWAYLHSMETSTLASMAKLPPSDGVDGLSATTKVSVGADFIAATGVPVRPGEEFADYKVEAFWTRPAVGAAWRRGTPRLVWGMPPDGPRVLLGELAE